MTADPGARGDQWPRTPGAYADRGPAGSSSSGGPHPPGPPWGGYDPPEPPRGARSGDRRVRDRRVAAVIALILGLAGFAVSAFGVAIQLLPRQFTASQQRQIEAWEVMRRWHTMPAGQIFPASVSYQLPARVLQDTVPLSLNAIRVGIAPQQSDCARAVTSEPAATVLRRIGCEAVLRATYVDATRSYVMTVGIAVLPNAVAATSADSGLATPRLAVARQASIQDRVPGGVLLIRFHGPGAGRYDYHRQISASFTAGPYLVMYAAGYADNRPRVPVSQDKYSDAEMTSMAEGVARTVAHTLAATPAPPHCPGAPGC